MLHGDISNSSEGSIAFRVDNFLFRLNPDGKTYKFDLNVFKAIENVYYASFYSVDIVCKLLSKNEFQFRNKLGKLLTEYNVPFGRIYIVKQDEEIRFHLTGGKYLYYIDDVVDRVAKISSDNCLNLSELNFLLKGRSKNARRVKY